MSYGYQLIFMILEELKARIKPFIDNKKKDVSYEELIKNIRNLDIEGKEIKEKSDTPQKPLILDVEYRFIITALALIENIRMATSITPGKQSIQNQLIANLGKDKFVVQMKQFPGMMGMDDDEEDQDREDRD
jgi:hypothetical protein